MNTLDAAKTWWSNLPHPNDALNLMKQYGTSIPVRESEVEQIWIQEMVLPWYEKETWLKLMNLPINEIATCYLKEHEVKEEVSPKTIYVPKVTRNGDVITIYGAGKFRESELTLKEGAAMMMFSELWKVLFPEQPEVSSPVKKKGVKVLNTDTQQILTVVNEVGFVQNGIRFIPCADHNNAINDYNVNFLSLPVSEKVIYFEQLGNQVVNCSSPHFGIYASELTKDEAIESFGIALKVKMKIKKEEDKELIQSLLDAIIVQQKSLATYGKHPLIQSQTDLAITKAKEYLNK